MKIKYIKCYQSVEFGKNKKSEASFLSKEYHSTSNLNTLPKVEFQEHEKGILVYTDDDVILVGWPNIAFVRYERETFRPEAGAKKAKA